MIIQLNIFAPFTYLCRNTGVTLRAIGLAWFAICWNYLAAPTSFATPLESSHTAVFGSSYQGASPQRTFIQPTTNNDSFHQSINQSHSRLSPEGIVQRSGRIILSDAPLPTHGTTHRQRPPINQPHPAVVRVIVPEKGATSYGSGTLVDVRGQFGLIITNWHVVRDAAGPVEVLFPDGFHSKARSLKVDSDWDLAALVIWKPLAEPVPISTRAPHPGDLLTICGYGQGIYRAVMGRCTKYYAPRLDFPRHMVELDVEARQGDSGGPIFNHQGEIAGVLFGAGQGTTLGSFGGRVGSFLATLAPDIGQRPNELDSKTNDMADQDSPTDQLPNKLELAAVPPVFETNQGSQANRSTQTGQGLAQDQPSRDMHADRSRALADQDQRQIEAAPSQPCRTQADDAAEAVSWLAFGTNRFEQTKSVLAAIGLLAIVAGILRAVR
jgi:serine protease Do